MGPVGCGRLAARARYWVASTGCLQPRTADVKLRRAMHLRKNITNNPVVSSGFQRMVPCIRRAASWPRVWSVKSRSSPAIKPHCASRRQRPPAIRRPSYANLSRLTPETPKAPLTAKSEGPSGSFGRSVQNRNGCWTHRMPSTTCPRFSTAYAIKLRGRKCRHVPPYGIADA